MKFRTVGKTGIRVSEIGQGTWELSGDVYGKKDDKVSMRALHVALDSGATFIDTAAGYGRGHAEELVGRVLKERKTERGQVVLCTKVLPKCGTFAPPPEKNIDDSYPPEWIIEQCEASLKRLQLEYVDMLFLHTWNPAWGHRTEWHDAMAQLKTQGKIRAIGISITDEGIADANVHIEAGRLDVVQCVYNIFQQEPEYTLFPLARKHGVGIIARSPFSSGALIGNWTKDMTFPEGDWRGIWPLSVKEGWLEEQVEMANHVKGAVETEGISMPAAALKYVLMNPDVSSVIPGSANPEHVKKNMAVSDAPALSDQCMQSLKQLWFERKIHGTYNGSI